MGFWELLEVASSPIIQVLLISALGAFMATDYFDNLLSSDFRKSLNKLVFIVFTPSLIFASFAKSVSLDDMISWWFMPVNIGFTFIIGGILGWIIVKLLKPNLKVEGLIIAACSSGNMGNLPVVIMPAICDEKEGPFGSRDACRTRALAYASFSLALGGVFIWTFTYQLVHDRSLRYKALEAAEILKIPNKNLDANAETLLLKGNDNEKAVIVVRQSNAIGDTENQIFLGNMIDAATIVSAMGCENYQNYNIAAAISIIVNQVPFWHRMIYALRNLLAELMSPPTIATFFGFLFGGIKWLRNLIIGQDAPLRVIQDTIQLLGDGTIPCITILLGGNLTQGMQSSSMQPLVLISVVIARLFILPAIGFFVVRAAANFGFLPVDPLFQYVLVMQYAMPPAMNISTMVQLFDVGTEECSVILLWSYGASTIALTIWSTFLMWVLA